ncbi:MAG: PEGA domain-containing protein [Spirochaetales bacterium]|nr:PEGA domain-containing protein [Spirochaetales bacterium]
MNRLTLSVILILVLSCLVFPEDNSGKLRIGIVLIENPRADAGIESLCDTATDTIELTLRLVNKYTVERLDFLTPEAYPDRAKLYFKSNSFDNAVFGQIERNEEGEYTFLIKGWERESDSIVVQTEETVDSVFAMFDIVDNLTIEFIEELSGEHIGFGKIVFINEGAEADYNIYVDGNYLGRNIEESEILFGERIFKITAPGRFGDTVVETVTIEVEENGEHSIVFSMGEAEAALTPAGSDEIVSIGNLFIDADPVESEVFLDDQSIGFTPLSLYGVGAGLYDLRVGKEYYQSASQVLRLEPNIDNTLSFDLGIDAEHPDIKKLLKDPVRTEIWAAGLTAGQLAWMMGRTLSSGGDSGPSMLNFTDVMIMTPRYGHLLAGDTKTGTILSLISFISFMGYTGVYDPVATFDDPLFLSAIILSQLGVIGYDLAGAPFASGRWNNSFLDKLKTDGVLFEGKKEKDPFRFTVQTGGGGIVHAGVSWSPLWDWLYFEQLGGVSLTQYLDILEPALSSTSKVLFYPFPDVMSLFNPYLGGLFNLGTDFNSANFAYGLASGFEIRFPLLDCFLEADVYISNEFGTVPVSLALGVRL